MPTAAMSGRKTIGANGEPPFITNNSRVAASEEAEPFLEDPAFLVVSVLVMKLAKLL